MWLFFDLDGTLTDPAIGITNSVMHALRHYGIEVADRQSLYPFIGPPLVDSFARYYHFGSDQAKEAVDFYREYFSTAGIFENVMYPGIPELLQQLKNEKYDLAVASSKPQPFVEKILEHFDLAKYMSLVVGATMQEKRSSKTEVIRYALTQCGCQEVPQNVLMIGDHQYDVIGAHENGLAACAVTYGYGDLTKIKNANPEFIADSVAEILACVRRNSSNVSCS